MNGFFPYAGLVLVAFAGGLLQTFCGFGAGVIILLYLARFSGMVTGAAVNLSICAFLAAYLLFRFRKKTEWRKTLLPMIPYLLVSIVFNRLIMRLDAHKNLLGILFGVFQIMLAVYYLFIAKNVKSSGNAVSGVLLGGASGMTSALFGVGGPFLSVYLLPVSKDAESYTANMQLVFTVTNIFVVAGKIRNGSYTLASLPATILGGIGVLLGGTFGIWLLKRTNPGNVKTAVYVFLAVSGVVTLIQYAF